MVALGGLTAPTRRRSGERGLVDDSEQIREVLLGLPANHLADGGDAGPFVRGERLHELRERQSELVERGAVLETTAVAVLALVLAERGVQQPVSALAHPVTAHRLTYLAEARLGRRRA